MQANIGHQRIDNDARSHTRTRTHIISFRRKFIVHNWKRQVIINFRLFYGWNTLQKYTPNSTSLIVI